jgi:hypothetical protein
MIVADLTTLGDYDMLPKQQPEKISFRVDDIDNQLDFESIKQTAKQAEKKLLLNKSSDTLTSSEKKAIPVYMNDIISYVKKYAKQGKFKFEYDCKNLTNTCFFELATEFKQKNPLFFVMTDSHMKILTVEWTGKNEV